MYWSRTRQLAFHCNVETAHWRCPPPPLQSLNWTILGILDTNVTPVSESDNEICLLPRSSTSRAQRLKTASDAPFRAQLRLAGTKSERNDPARRDPASSFQDWLENTLENCQLGRTNSRRRAHHEAGKICVSLENKLLSKHC